MLIPKGGLKSQHAIYEGVRNKPGASGSTGDSQAIPFSLGNYYAPIEDEADEFDRAFDENAGENGCTEQSASSGAFNSNHVYDGNHKQRDLSASAPRTKTADGKKEQPIVSKSIDTEDDSKPGEDEKETKKKRKHRKPKNDETGLVSSNAGELSVKSTPKSHRKHITEESGPQTKPSTPLSTQTKSRQQQKNNKLITAKFNGASSSTLESDTMNGSSSRPGSGKSANPGSRPMTGGPSRPTSGVSRPASGITRPKSGKSRPPTGSSIAQNNSGEMSLQAGHSRPTSGKTSQSRPQTGQSRPTSGKISSHGLANNQNGSLSEVRPRTSEQGSSTSASRPFSASRPQSGVSRKSITSIKDSLLSKRGGSGVQDGGLYGKSDDDDLEKYMTPPRSASNNHTQNMNAGETTQQSRENSRQSQGKGVEKLPPLTSITTTNTPSHPSQDENARPLSTASRPEEESEKSNIEESITPLTGRSTAYETYRDGSDDELKRLALQIDDSIYDPLASLENLKKSRQRGSSTKLQNNAHSTISLKAGTESKTPASVNGSKISLGDEGKIETEKSEGNANDDDDGENIWNDDVTNEPTNEFQEAGSSDQPRTESHQREDSPQKQTLPSTENDLTESTQEPEKSDKPSQGFLVKPINADIGSPIKSEEDKAKEGAGDTQGADGTKATYGAGANGAQATTDGDKMRATTGNGGGEGGTGGSKENFNIPVGDDDDEEGTVNNGEDDVTKSASAETEDIYRKKPRWHPPWQLRQEIVAHQGAIPELVIDPTNRWFATGSQDKTIRLWDINTGKQKLVIKAHKREIRALAFGATGHRKLYSAGDDRQLLCHDVEVNRVIQKFKGQTSVIYDMAIYHPENLLISCGRDKLLKVHDLRTEKIVRSMRGHTNTVSQVVTNNFHKMVISAGHDSTIRLWDIGDGRCISTLYGHKKSVRALCSDPDGKKFLSASSELILAWELPLGDMIQEIEAKDIAINTITSNQYGVVVAGGSNGYMNLWDFDTGFRFQRISRARVYESHEVPICVFASKFDKTGKKLICSDACNVVKIYGEAYTSRNVSNDVTMLSLPSGYNTPAQSASTNTQLKF
uniref:Uncharacterized protein n=1 Tax=Clytia hemisphaerica TaxID=252671 RepID=A0A7M5TY35_9CNID